MAPLLIVAEWVCHHIFEETSKLSLRAQDVPIKNENKTISSFVGYETYQGAFEGTGMDKQRLYTFGITLLLQ
jgi:hypothetical protein